MATSFPIRNGSRRACVLRSNRMRRQLDELFTLDAIERFALGENSKRFIYQE